MQKDEEEKGKGKEKAIATLKEWFRIFPEHMTLIAKHSKADKKDPFLMLRNKLGKDRRIESVLKDV